MGVDDRPYLNIPRIDHWICSIYSLPGTLHLLIKGRYTSGCDLWFYMWLTPFPVDKCLINGSHCHNIDKAHATVLLHN